MEENDICSLHFIRENFVHKTKHLEAGKHNLDEQNVFKY